MTRPYWSQILIEGCAELFAPARRVSTTITGLAVILYAASFFLTAYDDVGSVRGWQAFMMSRLALLHSGSREEGMVWLANPALWASGYLIMWRRPRAGFAFAAAAILFAVPLLVHNVDDLRSGYFIWLASMAVLMIAAVATWKEVINGRERC